MKPLNFRIDYQVNDSWFIFRMILLYVDAKKNFFENNKISKKDFMDYLKSSVQNFGLDSESQFGVDDSRFFKHYELDFGQQLFKDWFDGEIDLSKYGDTDY